MARILLADDDSDLRFLNKMVLSEAGYDVTTVANGLEATSAAQNQMFDLILLDAMMPEMDGYEAFRNLRSNPTTSTIPIVFLSAQIPDAKVKRELGVDKLDYILKPCDPDSLAEQIKVILDRNSSQRL